MTDKEVRAPDFKLLQNGTAADFHIGGQRMVMNAADIDSAIDLLRRIRELIQPQVSNEFPRTRQYCDTPRIGIVVDTENKIGVSLRHTGLGWIHFRFSRKDAAIRVRGALKKAILKSASRAESDDPLSKSTPEASLAKPRQ